MPSRICWVEGDVYNAVNFTREDFLGALKGFKGIYETAENPVPGRLMENVQMQGFRSPEE